MFLLDIKCKEDIEEYIPVLFPIIVAQDSIPILIRETAIITDLAIRSLKNLFFVPNRQERLAHIKQFANFKK